MSSPKQPTQTSQTVTQTNLPAYMEPFVTRLAGRAEEASNRPYEAYTGPRISDFTADQTRAMEGTRSLGSTWMGGMDQARGMLDTASSNIQNSLSQAGRTAQQALGGARQAFGSAQGALGAAQGSFLDSRDALRDAGGQGIFGDAQAQQYMNPFIQNVVNRSRAGALQTLMEQRARANSDLQSSAPFGSYADAVSKSLMERDYGNRIADQEANLLLQGYNNAQDQFQRDRSFTLDRGRFGLESGNLALNTGRLGLESGNLALDAGRFGIDQGNLGLRGSELIGSLANQQSQMAQQRRGLAAADLDALNRSGLQQQQQRQASLDMAYQDFVNQRDYSDNRLQFMNNILRGLPSQMGSETTSYAPPANPYSQLLGLGGTAVGLANAFSGRAS